MTLLTNLKYVVCCFIILFHMYKTRWTSKQPLPLKVWWLIWEKCSYLHIMHFIWIHQVLIFSWIQRNGILKNFNFTQLKISCTWNMNLVQKKCQTTKHSKQSQINDTVDYQLVHAEATSTKVTSEKEGGFFRMAIIHYIDLQFMVVNMIKSTEENYM